MPMKIIYKENSNLSGFSAYLGGTLSQLTRIIGVKLYIIYIYITLSVPLSRCIIVKQLSVNNKVACLMEEKFAVT